MNNDFEYIPKSLVVFNVTVRNAQDYIGNCLNTLQMQSDNNWLCRVTDDCSSDGTFDEILRYHKYDHRIITNKTAKRNYKLKNFMTNMEGLQAHDIVVELDGDDYLSEVDVVGDIRRLHKTYDLVWTQCETNTEGFPNWYTWPSTNLPDDWTRNNPKRDLIWNRSFHPNHLRTFKKFLFDKIDAANLYYNGEVIKAATDVAFYTPMVEMTLPQHRYFYDRVCMKYNISKNNVTFVDCEDKTLNQAFIADYLKNLTPQSKLKRSHIALILNSSDSLKAIRSQIVHLRNVYPEIILYIGILKNWDTSKFEDNYQYAGIRFVNLEKIMQVYYDESDLEKTYWACVSKSKYLMALYLLKTVQAEQFLILYKEGLQAVFDLGFNWLLNGEYEKSFNFVPTCVQQEDLPIIMQNLFNLKQVNGGIF